MSHASPPLLRALVARIVRHPLPVVGLAAALVALASAAARRVEIDYSVEQFFPTWGEERAIFEEYRAVFPGEDAQVALFLATPEGLDAGASEALERVAVAFAARGLEDVRWAGSDPAATRPHPLLDGIAWNDDGSVHVVQGRLSAEENHDAGRRALVSALTDDVEALGLGQRWALSGTPVIRAQVPELLEADQTVLLGGGIVLFFVILFAYFRRVGLVLVSLAAVAPAYVLMLALMALMGRPVTILTSFIPIVILVVGVCDTTHLLEHWRRARRDGMGRIDAVTHTLDGLAMSCLFTSVTTAVGFATLAATGIPVVGDFGLFTAFAVLATYAFTLTVLPALLVFVRRMPPARAPKSGLPVTLVRCARRVLARGDRWVVPAFAVVAVVAAGLASTLRIDTYLVDDLKEETRIKRDVRWIERSGFGLFQTNLFVRADAERLTASETLAWMERFQRFVESEPIVLDSYGLPDVVRSTESSRYSTISTGAVAASSWLLAPEEGAAQVVVAVRDAGSRETLAFFDRVEEHLADDPPPHGRADVTGTVRMAHTFSFHVLRSFGPSILLALGLIWLVMCALFRSVRMGLVAMVPNLFPLVTLAGAMALLGVPLKPSTILVFSIAFGIAVDDSIHLMSRYTQLMAGGRRSGRALRGALRETGPALVMSTVVVSAGFSLLLLSHFELLYLLGLLTALTAISALAADLLVFPALVALVGEVEVEEDGGDDGRIGQEREDPHLAATRGTEQRQHVVDPSEQDGPADSRRGGRSGGGLGGWAG